jgi:hypothetical protein
VVLVLQRKEAKVNVAGYAALTLYVGAAYAEASGDQKSLLNTKLPPMIRRMRAEAHDEEQWRLATQSLLIRIHEVMGRDWRPRGQTGLTIAHLLKEATQERGRRKE